MLYSNIAKLCQEKHITISRLEKECGLGNATVRGWREMRDAPRFSTIKRVSDFIGVNVDELMKEGTGAATDT